MSPGSYRPQTNSAAQRSTSCRLLGGGVGVGARCCSVDLRSCSALRPGRRLMRASIRSRICFRVPPGEPAARRCSAVRRRTARSITRPRGNANVPTPQRPANAATWHASHIGIDPRPAATITGTTSHLSDRGDPAQTARQRSGVHRENPAGDARQQQQNEADEHERGEHAHRSVRHHRQPSSARRVSTAGPTAGRHNSREPGNVSRVVVWDGLPLPARTVPDALSQLTWRVLGPLKGRSRSVPEWAGLGGHPPGDGSSGGQPSWGDGSGGRSAGGSGGGGRCSASAGPGPGA
jgi:hypothetical protein